MPTILIAGKAGEGIKKAANVVAEQLLTAGYHCFQYDDYQSVIKGGHNYSVITFNPQRVYHSSVHPDFAFFTDKDCVKIHEKSLIKSTEMIINSQVGDRCWDFKKSFADHKLEDIYFGVCAITSVLHYFGFSSEEIEQTIRKSFRRDIEKNLLAFQLTMQLLSGEKSVSLKRYNSSGNRFYSGNTLIAFGLLASGLDYYTGYPMTPASSVLHTLASRKDEFGLIVQHAESEIAAVNMAIGATFSGARSATGSSGGGVALMVEAFSMAGMVEAPVFILNSARPGPATGMSTYTAQSDLNFILNMGHGEFSRIVASPKDFEDCFFLTAELMDLAWKFQVPVVLLTEKQMSESMMDVKVDLDQYQPLDLELSGEVDYLRYRLTDNGVSPLQFSPSDSMIKWNSNEHLESGIRTDQAEEAIHMIEKRNRKGEYLSGWIKEHIKMLEVDGEGLSIVSYGSSCLAVKEAMQYLTTPVKLIQIRYLEPFPTERLNDLLTDDFIVVEQSITAQFAELIRSKTGKKARNIIKRYDGRPFDPAELAEQIEEAFHGWQIDK